MGKLLASDVESSGNRAVLIVEDEVGVRRALSRVLSEWGFRTTEAANGREAIRCLAEETPVAIVIDLLMPVMSGIELLKALRRNAFYRRIPTIVMTGALDVVAPSLGATLGVPVVLKPNIERVPEMIHRLVAEVDAANAALRPMGEILKRDSARPVR
jgi:CheY-like chemotaxis protein